MYVLKKYAYKHCPNLWPTTQVGKSDGHKQSVQNHRRRNDCPHKTDQNNLNGVMRFVTPIGFSFFSHAMLSNIMTINLHYFHPLKEKAHEQDYLLFIAEIGLCEISVFLNKSNVIWSLILCYLQKYIDNLRKIQTMYITQMYVC